MGQRQRFTPEFKRQAVQVFGFGRPSRDPPSLCDSRALFLLRVRSFGRLAKQITGDGD